MQAILSPHNFKFTEQLSNQTKEANYLQANEREDLHIVDLRNENVVFPVFNFVLSCGLRCEKALSNRIKSI